MRNKSIKIKKNNFIYFVFCFFVFIILFLTVGFSAYSTNLSIDGSALVRSSADVRITDYKVSNTNSARSNSSEFTNNSITSNNYISWYWSTITYDVTVTNLSSSNVLVTDATALVFDNDIFAYHFENLEINKTVIPAASTYTFQVVYEVEEGMKSFLEGAGDKLENILGADKLTLQSTIKFTFYKIPQYNYEITATPSDSLITLESDGNVVASGTGYVKALVDEGSNISWSVSKDGYYTESGVDTITGAVSKNIDLIRTEEKNFTVVPTPSDSLVTIKQGDEVLASDTGAQTVIVDDLSEVTYTVSKFEYYEKTGSYTINGYDYTENVVLEEMPWITGTFTNTNRESATTKEDTVYHPGYYLIELWGGKGGSYLRASDKSVGYGGDVGHIYGVVYLDYNSTIYYTLGGNGRDGQLSGTAKGGANGGGAGGATYAGGGGGYSAISLNASTIDATTINAKNVLMIAGAGGAGSGSSLVSGKPGDGGKGGSIGSATTSINIGTVFHGDDGTLNGAKEGYNGFGGTTTSITQSNAGAAGGLLFGGAGSRNGGGGGAGYYGGAGGGGAGTLSSNQAGGGGGGSSFIASSVTFSGLSSTITSNLISNNPSATGGAIVITYLGKTI